MPFLNAERERRDNERPPNPPTRRGEEILLTVGVLGAVVPAAVLAGGGVAETFVVLRLAFVTLSGLQGKAFLCSGTS